MVASLVLDGPINGEWFGAYVGQVLVPTVKRGDVVILDNLSSHKRPAARAMIKAAGARMMFLPPYSPNFNPMEKAFSKLKALLRKAAGRTVTRLWDRTGKTDQLHRAPRSSKLLQFVRIQSDMPSPFPHIDFLTSATNKNLRGPRGGLIVCRDAAMGRKIDSAMFPGIQRPATQRRRLAMAVREAHPQPLAFGASSMGARHIGRGPGLIDEDETRRIEIELLVEPALALLQDDRTDLL